MTIATDHKPKAAPVKGLARGVAGRAVGWWLGELHAVYDDSTRRFSARQRAALTIEAGERYWILRQRQRIIGQLDRAGGDDDAQRQALIELVPPSARRAALIVEIPQERVLSKIVALPAGARGELDRILEFEIARHFPFPAERVFFRHRLIGRAAASGAGPIEVELVAVPRDIVAEICGALDEAGLRPRGIAVAGGQGEERLFLPAAALGPARAVLAPARRALIVAIAVLAVAALVSWPLAQQIRLAGVESDLAALKPQAETVLKAREQQQGEADRDAAVLRLRGERPPLVAVLDALTRAVPDGSWLLSLGLSGRDLAIDGLSPSAATIALALEHSGSFSGIQFRSPITRDPATGLEHFRLGATVAPGAAPAGAKP